MSTVIEVLPFVLGHRSPVQGMYGAAVVASEAEHAVAAPLRTIPTPTLSGREGARRRWILFHLDVVVGADLFATSAADAGISRLEGTWRNEKTVEEGTNKVALDPCQAPWQRVGDAGCTCLQGCDDVGNAFPCLIMFPSFFLRTIDIEAWQTDVGFGHLNSPGSGTAPTTLTDGVAEDFVGLAGVVATGSHHIYIADVLHLKMSDEDFDKAGHAPGIGGEDEAETFTLGEFIGRFADAGFGNKYQAFAKLPS